MDGDLFPPDQEEIWRRQIIEAQHRFEDRVWAIVHDRNKARRKKYYTELRKEIGDDAAREVAKMVEGIHAGTARYPKWFRKLP